MSQLNDAIYAALNPTYGPGQLNDLLLRYYQAKGAVSDDIDDAEREFLLVQIGVVPGTENDMWYQYTGLQGHTGALNDRLLQYWKSFNPEIFENLTDEALANITDENLEPITVRVG